MARCNGSVVVMRLTNGRTSSDAPSTTGPFPGLLRIGGCDGSALVIGAALVLIRGPECRGALADVVAPGGVSEHATRRSAAITRDARRIELAQLLLRHRPPAMDLG